MPLYGQGRKSLGHKILSLWIEVDKSKVDVIAKLPHPTTVKGIRSFLGHAGFYRRFIQDFSKIARPMTHLLEKETPFIFSKECIEAFETLKMKLTQAPILQIPAFILLSFFGDNLSHRIALGMERDCQHGLYKAGMGSSRVLSDFAEKYGSKNRVLAGFGIGGKSGKEKVYKLGCDRERLKMN
ncbi:hypothetical protein Tco_0266506 [Tanacetum coccineum]